MMKKNVRKQTSNTAYRNETQELVKNFGLQMKIVRNAPKSYYYREGGVRNIK